MDIHVFFKVATTLPHFVKNKMTLHVFRVILRALCPNLHLRVLRFVHETTRASPPHTNCPIRMSLCKRCGHPDKGSSKEHMKGPRRVQKRAPPNAATVQVPLNLCAQPTLPKGCMQPYWEIWWCKHHVASLATRQLQ